MHMPLTRRRFVACLGTTTPALALASSFSLEEGEAKAVQPCTITEGNLKVVLRDNARSPKLLSGLASLFHQKDAPAFDAFDPDSPGASAGLNFEHIISGHKNTRKLESGEEYGFKARLVWKKFVSPEDCLKQYETWASSMC